MGDVSQESGEPRLQFIISFCVVPRSEACSDSNEAMERGATAAVVKGDRVAPFVNHAVAIQGDKAQLMSCTSTL